MKCALLLIVVLAVRGLPQERTGVAGLEDLIHGPPVSDGESAVKVEPAPYSAHFRRENGK